MMTLLTNFRNVPPVLSALLQLGGESNHKVVLLLVVHVHLVWHKLCQVVE
jgi:hypothetical protein